MVPPPLRSLSSVSATHLVLVPSYNSGARLAETLRGARAAWAPVWAVVDGSTDGSAAAAEALAASDPALRVIRRACRGGKGRAVRTGLEAAAAAGFASALVMDADGQHPAALIPAMMALAAPGTAVFGSPVFGPDAPRLRVQARRLSNWCARAAIGGPVPDALFGFRVYPICPLLAAFRQTRGMRGYDFDPEALVRLRWAGVPIAEVAAPVRYPADGVSHFRPWRDTLALAAMHARLLTLRLAGAGRRDGTAAAGARPR